MGLRWFAPAAARIFAAGLMVSTAQAAGLRLFEVPADAGGPALSVARRQH